MRSLLPPAARSVRVRFPMRKPTSCSSGEVEIASKLICLPSGVRSAIRWTRPRPAPRFLSRFSCTLHVRLHHDRAIGPLGARSGYGAARGHELTPASRSVTISTGNAPARSNTSRMRPSVLPSRSRHDRHKPLAERVMRWCVDAKHRSGILVERSSRSRRAGHADPIRHPRLTTSRPVRAQVIVDVEHGWFVRFDASCVEISPRLVP